MNKEKNVKDLEMTAMGLEKRLAIPNYAYEKSSEKVNPRLTELSKIFKKKVYKTAENVYTAFGFAVDAPVMIVGDDGLIIIDPCESFEAMQEVNVYFREISQLPIKAILYTHHHPDHWAGIKALFPNIDHIEQHIKDNDIKIIAHKEFTAGVAKESGMLVDIKTARSLYMYGTLLPVNEEGRVNIGNGPSLENGTQYLVLPNLLVDDELKLTVAGVEMEIYHVPSECSDEICVWLPQSKVLHVAECIQGENYPNIYSIRGSNRNPVNWIKSVDFMRQFPAQYLVGNHMRPVEGEEASAKHLIDYRDMIQYTVDQTIRLINKGYTPENIVNELEKLPPHLYHRPRIGEHYGTFIQGIRLVYSTFVGWFNGDAKHLEPHSPYELSKRYVELIGEDKLYEQVEEALKQKDYKWAIELASHLITVNRDDMKARNMKACALKELGYLTENAPFRSWYITQAFNLEGKFEEIKRAIPEFNTSAIYIKPLVQLPVENLFDIVKVKLNGPKAVNDHFMIRLELKDKECVWDLEIRKGIIELHPAFSKEVKGIISLTHEDFAILFTKTAKVEDFIATGNIKSELTTEEVVHFFDLFDGFTPLFDMEFPFS